MKINIHLLSEAEANFLGFLKIETGAYYAKDDFFYTFINRKSRKNGLVKRTGIYHKMPIIYSMVRIALHLKWTHSTSLFGVYTLSLSFYNLKYILPSRPTSGESYFPFRALLISRLKKAYAKGFIAEFRTIIGILYAKSLLHERCSWVVWFPKTLIWRKLHRK